MSFDSEQARSEIGRYSHDTLFKKLKIVLSELEYDNELFESLLCSMPERLRQVLEADGGHTNFLLVELANLDFCFVFGK